jgi:hypothetical protein
MQHWWFCCAVNRNVAAFAYVLICPAEHPVV